MSMTSLESSGAPADPRPRSWELWVRSRGAEVVVMMRVGRQVSELSLSGEGDVLGALGEVLGALGR
ncbi:hypothetical protein [Spongiactinospora sp. TRM90649]|uniref:hypothetical protein n=1 Tax=Spongiactinospora sp. TRM90649 TaxID=3031114 RepID=UPI0023FA263B|nr:hypothetical protein [Spongiactinospora sp. TRM90649]MDF5753814.1 hypothetical protein [Spongiactinospora sp. TRM90649]